MTTDAGKMTNDEWAIVGRLCETATNQNWRLTQTPYKSCVCKNPYTRRSTEF